MPTRRAAATALALLLTLAACAGTGGGSGRGPDGGPGGLSAPGRCVTVDEPWYATSAELEAAADVITAGTIAAVAEKGDHWVVRLSTRTAAGPAAEHAVGDITVNVMALCGDAPYGETFDVGGEFVMLLSGPVDGAFVPVNTTQGLLPVVDGEGVPLPGAGDPAVSLGQATAAAMGTPLRGPHVPADFRPADGTVGIPDGVAPQFATVDAGAAWSPDPGVLWVFTAGSSGCPVTPAAEAVADEDGVRVVLSTGLGPDDACNDDRAMSTYQVAVPAGVDETVPLTLAFEPDGTPRSGEAATVVVGPRPATGQPGPASWAAPSSPQWALDADNLLPVPGGWARGLPTAVPSPAEARAGAAWTAQDGVLYVFTWGSSSCPAVAQSPATTDGSGVAVAFVPTAPDVMCTMDLAPTTSVVAVPQGADDGADLTVRLGDLGTVVVPPRGPEHQAGVTMLVGPPVWLP